MKVIQTVSLVLEKNEIYERCALCGKILNIRKDTPIRCRSNYVEGSGQLCSACSREIREEM